MRNLGYHRYEELTAQQLNDALAERSLVFVPIGSMEFHGRHLPLGLDTLHAYEFCTSVARQTGGVVLPPTYWNANGHVGWPGSMLVRERTFRALVRDIIGLLAAQHVRLVVISTGHWPQKQAATIARLAREAMDDLPGSPEILTLDPFGCNPYDSTPGHGGKTETSLMLALRPDLVDMHELEKGEEALAGIGDDAGDGSAEFGRKYFDDSVQNCADIVKEALVTLAQSHGTPSAPTI